MLIDHFRRSINFCCFTLTSGQMEFNKIPINFSENGEMHKTNRGKESDERVTEVIASRNFPFDHDLTVATVAIYGKWLSIHPLGGT